MMIIEQFSARSKLPLTPGRHKIIVDTEFAGPGKKGTVKLLVDGEEVAAIVLNRTVPAAFSASESFDVGVDLGSVVSLDYSDRRPFEFNGTIRTVQVKMEAN